MRAMAVLSVLAAVMLLVVWSTRVPPPSEVSEEQRTSSQRHSGQDAATDAVDVLPSGLPSLADLPCEEQERLAAALMDRRDLSSRERDSVQEQISNRFLSPLTRNNLANALLNQSEKDLTLPMFFLQMVNDPQEDPIWRDYALQFLSQTLAFAGEPDTIVAAMGEIAEGPEGDLQGTAVVQLVLQEGWGQIDLPADFSQTLVRILQSPLTTRATRLSTLAALGKRGDSAHTECIREYAIQDADAGLKRVAIAALGLMRDREALPMIQTALEHENRSVRLAAEGALSRLTGRAGVQEQ